MDRSCENSTQILSYIEGLRSGDLAARDQLINHSCNRLRALARRMLRDFPRLRRWEETDDVFQTAVVRLHRALSEVSPGNVREYFQLAAVQIRRTLLDLARHHYGAEGAAAHHQTDHFDAGEKKKPLAEQAPSPVDDCTMWTDFHQQVATLPNAEREVVELLWYQGLSQTHAAQVLGTTDRTIRRHWVSARLRLGKLLEQQNECHRG